MDPFGEPTNPPHTPRYYQGRKLFGGRYTLVKALGKGGMGEVWLAHDNELATHRALKFAPPEVAADARSVAMLKREAIAGTSLAHVNIVRIFDFAHDPHAGGSAVAMEGIDGKTLADLQPERIEADGPGFFEPDEIERWLRDIAAALDYAHGEGRAHRDLKPMNIMVETATGRAKIMDFGISRRIGDSHTMLTGRDSGGTLPYMSPQQVMGGKATADDDIYGLGATLYDLLTGGPPFFGGDVAAQVKEKAPDAIHDRRMAAWETAGQPLPAAWEAALFRCLAKLPDDRPKSAAAVLAALSTPAVPAPASAAAATAASPAPKPARSPMDGQKAGETCSIFLPAGVELPLHYCPPGVFTMGSPASEADRIDNEAQAKVVLTHGFWLARTPLTQEQWTTVMGNNPSHWKIPTHPVENVSWHDATQFIEKLNGLNLLPSTHQWALPTEAQWEYACRAGTTTPFSFGDSLGSHQANFDGNYPYGNAPRGEYLQMTSPVGRYPANPWGLADMHGNVLEGCADAWDGKSALPGGTNPLGGSGSDHVNRGGCWLGFGRSCRSASRHGLTPECRYEYLGFRPAAVPAGSR